MQEICPFPVARVKPATRLKGKAFWNNILPRVNRIWADIDAPGHTSHTVVYLGVPGPLMMCPCFIHGCFSLKGT